MMKRIMILLLVLSLCIAVVSAKTVTVSIDDLAFIPENIDVDVGDTVEWTNNDFPTTNHQITSVIFESDNLAPGETFSFTFTRQGIVSYLSKRSPIATGEITVNAGTGLPGSDATTFVEALEAGELVDVGPVSELSFDELLALMDRFTGEGLVNISPICDVLEDAKGQVDFACQPDGVFRIVKDERPLFLVSHPDDQAGNMGCCPANTCWTGEECLEDQTDDPKGGLYNGKRCLGGLLAVSPPKFRFDRSQKGFCPQEGQCLLNIDGTPENNNKPEEYSPSNHLNSPVCIADGQYVFENMCEAGDWTSRTKYIALQLSQLGEANGGDYTIFCDEFEEVLNFFSYAPEGSQGAVAREFLEDPACKRDSKGRGRCVNQFCGMAYKDGIAYGTSLNQDIDSPMKSFLIALGLEPDDCNTVSGSSEEFVECQPGSNIYYNPLLHSVISIPAGDIPMRSLADLKYAEDVIMDPFERIAQKALDRMDQGEFVGRSLIFSRIYIDKRGDKDYFSFVAENIADRDRSSLPNTYVAGTYNKIDISDPSGRNPCTLISTVDPGILAGSGYCDYDPSSKQVDFVRFSLGDAPNRLEENWRDVTAKFRVG